MLVAIASNENHLKGIVDPHFGRCDWYCIYNTNSGEKEFIENPARYLEEGAGCQSAEMLVKQNIKMVVAGRFGSKVVEIFKTNNIQMVIPSNETILENILNQFKNK